MKYFALIIIASLGLVSCNHDDPAKHHEAMKLRMDSLRSDLLKADLAFSEMSEQKGRNAAFIEYAMDNATMLRPFSMPVTGKDTIISLFAAHPDSIYKLTWVPIKAEVSHSGDLGFTYGTYTLEIKNIEKKEGGTYCTIWKKNKEHKWKFILDTGNEGLKSADEASDEAIKSEEKAELKKEEKSKK
jgi:ketosteroid isomerase-like protein